METRERQDSFRWVILFMLFAATTINYLDRQILAILKPTLDEEFGWTDTQYAMIMSVFQGAYAIGLTLFGWIVDKYGAKLGFAVSIAWWSIGAMLHALAVGVTSMGACRVVLGLGEGGNFPSCIKMVTSWFRAKERVLATTLFNSGSNVGAMVAPAIVPLVAVAWGWQAAFIAVGALGFIWLVFWLQMPKEPRAALAEESAVVGEREAKGEKIPWRELLCYRQTWSLIIVRFMTDPVWWFFLFWLPDFFKKQFNCDIKESMAPLVTIYAIVTVLSIGGGWFTKWLAVKGWNVNRVRKVSMLIFASCVFPVVFVQSLGMWQIVCLIGLAGAAHQAWSANVYTLGSDMFPKSDVASVTGLTSMAGQVGSMLFVLAVGLILDHYKDMGNAADGYDVIFMICGSAYLVSFVIFSLIVPRIGRVSSHSAEEAGI